MKDEFASAMQRALGLTRAGDPVAATRAIQEALAARAGSAGADPAGMKDVTPADGAPRTGGQLGAAPLRARVGKTLGEVVRSLRDGVPGLQDRVDLPGQRAARAAPVVAQGAHFLSRSHSASAGTRDYRLYRPTTDRPRGLVVMLHGCTQTPEDFAVGTGMNQVAEAHGLLVAYPGQTNAHNAASCWNWFDPLHQKRGGGEPEILAGIARDLAAEYGLSHDTVFVAGLSAGGAMAAVLGAAYPDLFAAVGVHSGLPAGAANDVVSAFSAMRGGAAPVPRPAPKHRTIVFHGSADTTVHPANAAQIAVAAGPVTARIEGRSAGGRRYTRSIHGSGMESWLIEGAGHAWSGGQAAGSFTDPLGPDASAEMVRFFLER